MDPFRAGISVMRRQRDRIISICTSRLGRKNMHYLEAHYITLWSPLVNERLQYFGNLIHLNLQGALSRLNFMF